MKRFLRLLLAVPAAALVLTLSAPAVGADGGRVPLPQIPGAQKGESCVEPVDVMRRRHMDFLMHHRDATMHEGIRTRQYSLKECIECHVPPEPVSASAAGQEGHFCQNCHQYAGVRFDCFECHADRPGEEVQSSFRVPPSMNRETPESAAMLNKLAAGAYE